MNRIVQRMISFPGVIGLLQISSPSINLTWDQVYFLKAVRNVTRLEILSRLKWPMRHFPLIATLNPIELRLLHGQSNLGIWIKLADAALGGTIAKETQYWASHYCPNFRLLTPRLAVLELAECPDDTEEARLLRTSSDDLHFEYGAYITPESLPLPDTLTSLDLYEDSHGKLRDLLPSLPSSLRNLKVCSPDSTIDSALIFRYLPHLEHLSLSVDYEDEKPGKPFSKSLIPSLVSLSIMAFDLTHALDYCKIYDLEDSSLMKLVVWYASTSNGSAELDFAKLLPSSLTDLRCRSALFYNPIISLPPHLTTLHIIYTPNSVHLFDLIATLPLIDLFIATSTAQPLRLVDKHRWSTAPPAATLATSTLPRTLTSLILFCKKMSADSIRSLPPNLTWLDMSFFDAALIPILQTQCPRCHLYASVPCDLKSLPLEPFFNNLDFGNEWPFTVDMSDWCGLFLDSLARNRCHFQLRISADMEHPVPLAKRLKFDATHPSFRRLFTYNANLLEQFLVGLTNLQELRLKSNIKDGEIRFEDFPPTLTHLEIDDPQLTMEPHRPFRSTSLTFISTNSKLGSCRHWSPPQTLTHLDAPNWAVESSKIRRWTLLNFEKVSLHIIGPFDFAVPDFIAGDHFNAKTRFNMRLRISYGLTGIVGLRKGSCRIDLPEILRSVSDWLESQLSKPAPRDASLRGLKAKAARLKDSVASSSPGIHDRTLSHLFFQNQLDRFSLSTGRFHGALARHRFTNHA